MWIGPQGNGLYNAPMPKHVFDELKEYIGFNARDAANLRDLGEHLFPFFPSVVDRFYTVLLRHPGASKVFTSPEQVERLHAELAKWLHTLFCGCYDDSYRVQREEIGRTHVRVGLPQHYMFASMEVIRQELHARILESDIVAPHEKLESLHKILSIEIGIMLETFKESYSEQIREFERLALRERLVRAEHLAQVGQLAASLAHEIKNPLAGISGAVQVIRDGTPADDARQPVLAEILRQIERLDGTVEDLLVYARPKLPNLRPCKVHVAIQRAVALLRQQSQLQRIHLDYSSDGDLPMIDADEDQIEQVLMNIILNATHASADAQIVRISARVDDEAIDIIVEDQGHGMSEKVRQRAFEPFFTTKVRGTGLGLAICQQIVSAHEGHIDLHSSPGAGTTVVVRLPRKHVQLLPGFANVHTSIDR